MLHIPTKKLTEYAIIPSYGSDGAIGADLYADLSNDPDEYGNTGSLWLLPSGRHKLFKTGIAMAIPVTHYGRIAPRSGLAYKKGIDVLGGVIDSDYRGELGVILLNASSEDVVIQHGDRIAQIIFTRADVGAFGEVDELPDSVRGAGAFGSTGQ